MIHKTAIIEDGARIGADVKIGPFCFVGKKVVLHDGVELKSHVCVEGSTEIGSGTILFPFAVIGHSPQDLKYAGEDSSIKIGCNNKIRESVTIHPGTLGGRMETVIGDNCLLMANSHVAHDCIVGDNVIIANCGTLGGHVVIGDHSVIGGLTAIHQFVRIGAHSMIGGMSGVSHDIVPYALASGNRAELLGVNLIGIKRYGFSKQSILNIQKAFNILFDNKEKNFSEKFSELKNKFAGIKEIDLIIDFVDANTTRQFLM